jgi:hypothetical protein
VLPEFCGARISRSLQQSESLNFSYPCPPGFRRAGHQQKKGERREGLNITRSTASLLTSTELIFADPLDSYFPSLPVHSRDNPNQPAAAAG